MIQSFRDLEIYKESYELMIAVHHHLHLLPATERHELASQMRRASKSCPANIAEGWAKRASEKEFRYYLGTTLGSTNEMEVHIRIALDLGYWPENISSQLIDRYHKLGGKIVNLQRNWKTY